MPRSSAAVFLISDERAPWSALRFATRAFWSATSFFSCACARLRVGQLVAADARG